MAGRAARTATGAAIFHPNTHAKNTADQSPLSRLDNAAYIAVLKRSGLREDEAVSVLLHEFRIDPHGAARARQQYAEAPPPPTYGNEAGK